MSAPALIHVYYPLVHGRLVLRSDADWERDIEARAVDGAGQCHKFELPMGGRAFQYYKPVLLSGGEARWAQGGNYLVLAAGGEPQRIYPYFFGDGGGGVSDLRECYSEQLAVGYAWRAYCPPGYAENYLKRYPVLYMQDGQNLFFAEEASYGQHWRVPETLTLLAAMNAIHEVIVVGIYANEREQDYTQPGYERYGRFLVEALKPAVDAEFRTLADCGHTAVMGSSLGGVVSFFLAWRWPEVFGMASCLSSTFGWRDDLQERVRSENKKAIRLYLDSGWPDDNYEATRDMRKLLVARGYREGEDLLYFAFPEARHDERHWAGRSHLPYQYLFGV